MYWTKCDKLLTNDNKVINCQNCPCGYYALFALVSYYMDQKTGSVSYCQYPSIFIEAHEVIDNKIHGGEYCRKCIEINRTPDENDQVGYIKGCFCCWEDCYDWNEETWECTQTVEHCDDCSETFVYRLSPCFDKYDDFAAWFYGGCGTERQPDGKYPDIWDYWGSYKYMTGAVYDCIENYYLPNAKLRFFLSVNVEITRYTRSMAILESTNDNYTYLYSDPYYAYHYEFYIGYLNNRSCKLPTSPGNLDVKYHIHTTDYFSSYQSHTHLIEQTDPAIGAAAKAAAWQEMKAIINSEILGNVYENYIEESNYTQGLGYHPEWGGYVWNQYAPICWNSDSLATEGFRYPDSEPPSVYNSYSELKFQKTPWLSDIYTGIKVKIKTYSIIPKHWGNDIICRETKGNYGEDIYKLISESIMEFRWGETFRIDKVHNTVLPLGTGECQDIIDYYYYYFPCFLRHWMDYCANGTHTIHGYVEIKLLSYIKD